MANNRVVVNFDFKANMGNIQTNLSALKNNLLQIQTIGAQSSSFLGLNQGLKNATIAAQQLQTHMAAAMNPMTKQLDLSMLSKSLTSAGLNITKLSADLLGAGTTGQQAFRNLALSIASAQAPALQLSATMTKMMTTFANNARWMISSSVLTGFISGIRDAVNYTKDLNSALTDIRVVTGKSTEEMDKLARSSNKMAKELKASTLDIAKAQLIYYQQGDSAALAAKKAEITTKAANIAFTANAQQMSEYLTAIWNSYQVGEENLESFVDTIAAVGATTATSMEEIATAMQKVAATGNAVGVSYEQLIATIATISSVTRTSGEQVGTALKTIYARIGDLKAGGLDEDDIGLGQVSSGLKRMGVDILDAQDNIRDMGEVVEEIGGKWKGWTEAQQQAIVQLIAGKRQYTQMMALFENWDMYADTLSTAENADGELDKQQQIWAESWEAASKNVQASLEAIYTKIFDDDAFIDLLNGLNVAITGFDHLTSAMGGLGPIIMQISALLINHFKIPILDGLKSVGSAFGVLTGQAQKAHDQMRAQFFSGIDFSQMSNGLRFEIQTLGELTAVQDTYKMNLSQIHKSKRLEIEQSIEVANALRNEAMRQQELADKQKQSISNTIAASKASATAKEAARNNIAVVSEKALQAEMARNVMRGTFQDSTGKFNPSAMLNKSGKTSSDADRGEFLAKNQEKFNSVLQQTKKALEEEIAKNKEIIAANEQKLSQEKELAAIANKKNFEQSSKGVERQALLNKKQSGADLTGDEKARLAELNKEYGALTGAITRATNARRQAQEAINGAKTSLTENEAQLKKTQAAISTIQSAMSGGSVPANQFKDAVNTINQALKNGAVSQDQFGAEIREIGASLGLTGAQLDQFVKEIFEFIQSGAAANMSQEEFQRHLEQTKNKLIEAGDAANNFNKKITGESLMGAASAMMSLSSATSSITSAVKTFGDEGASASDKVTAGLGAVTQGIFAVSMAAKMLAGSNPWLIAIVIALSALPLIIQGLDAVIETQAEKTERLKKEAEELTEKYNEQKSVIDELQAKKEAGVDNQAALDALDAEIKREEIKLDLLEKQKKAKEEEVTLAQINEEKDKYGKHGTETKSAQAEIDKMAGNLYNGLSSQLMTSEGQEVFQELLEKFNEGKISIQEIKKEIAEDPTRFFPVETMEEDASYAIEILDNLSVGVEENLQDNLNSLELFTKNGVDLSDEFLNTLKTNMSAVYGDTLGPEAIRTLAAYYKDIDKLSETELQSLLETLFPEEDKDKLVERFRQGLQEINNEMNKFGKGATLAKSVENMDKAIDKVQSALKEIDDIGFMSYSTIEEMGAALDKAGVASAEWKQALYDANGNAEKTKEVLDQIANEIVNASIEAQKFSTNLHFDKNGDLTSESQQYVQNVENMIAAQLRSNGVQNASEVAHKKVQTQILKSKIAHSDLDKSVDEIAKSFLAEANAIGIAEEELKLYIQAEKMYSPDATVSDILKVANSFMEIALSAGIAADAVGHYQRMVSTSAGHWELDDFGNQVWVAGIDYSKEDWLNAADKIKKEVFQFKGFDFEDINVSVTDPDDDEKEKKEPEWKTELEKKKRDLDIALRKNQITKEKYAQELTKLYNDYKKHALDPDGNGSDYQEYFLDLYEEAFNAYNNFYREDMPKLVANATQDNITDLKAIFKNYTTNFDEMFKNIPTEHKGFIEWTNNFKDGIKNTVDSLADAFDYQELMEGNRNGESLAFKNLDTIVENLITIIKKQNPNLSEAQINELREAVKPFIMEKQKEANYNDLENNAKNTKFKVTKGTDGNSAIGKKDFLNFLGADISTDKYKYTYEQEQNIMNARIDNAINSIQALEDNLENEIKDAELAGKPLTNEQIAEKRKIITDSASNLAKAGVIAGLTPEQMEQIKNIERNAKTGQWGTGEEQLDEMISSTSEGKVTTDKITDIFNAISNKDSKKGNVYSPEAQKEKKDSTIDSLVSNIDKQMSQVETDKAQAEAKGETIDERARYNAIRINALSTYNHLKTLDEKRAEKYYEEAITPLDEKIKEYDTDNLDDFINEVSNDKIGKIEGKTVKPLLSKFQNLRKKANLTPEQEKETNQSFLDGAISRVNNTLDDYQYSYETNLEKGIDKSSDYQKQLNDLLAEEEINLQILKTSGDFTEEQIAQYQREAIDPIYAALESIKGDRNAKKLDQFSASKDIKGKDDFGTFINEYQTIRDSQHMTEEEERAESEKFSQSIISNAKNARKVIDDKYNALELDGKSDPEGKLRELRTYYGQVYDEYKTLNDEGETEAAEKLKQEVLIPTMKDIEKISGQNFEQLIDTSTKKIGFSKSTIDKIVAQFKTDTKLLSLTPEKTEELRETAIEGITSGLSTAASRLEKSWEASEFFGGTIDYGERISDMDTMVDLAYDGLNALKEIGATDEEQQDYYDKEILPRLKQRRDILAQALDHANELSEHYIKMSEFYGYKDGDNEIKARLRVQARLVQLTDEEIKAKYGTYEKYWQALEEGRLEIDQIIRDKLKEALEKEKDDRIAILEAEKNAAEKLFEGESTLREKRKQINDQLQESLTMYQYLDKATRKLIFNEKDFIKLSNTLNNIEQEMYDLNQQYLKDIVGKEADELEYINSEYERQNELLMKKYEIAEKELEVAKARTALENTLNERNTQMFINGRWQWVADQKAVIEAQKALNDAEFDKETAELEQTQELTLQSFEKQIEETNKQWAEATKVFDETVMTVNEILESCGGNIDEVSRRFLKLAANMDIASSSEYLGAVNEIVYLKKEWMRGQAEGNEGLMKWAAEESAKYYQQLYDAGYGAIADKLKVSNVAQAINLKNDLYENAAVRSGDIENIGTDATAHAKQIIDKQNTDTVKTAIENSSEEEQKSLQTVINHLVYGLDNEKLYSKEQITAFRKAAADQAYSMGLTTIAQQIGNMTAAEANQLLSDIKTLIPQVRETKQVIDNGTDKSNTGKDGTLPNGLIVSYEQWEKEFKSKGLPWTPISGYAKGTRSALMGLHQINEIGEETFVTPDGHFRNFAGGEVVFTHEQSQRLFSILNADLLSTGAGLGNVGNFEQSNSNDTYINIGGISVDTTSQDGKDLVEILQRITNI